MIEPNAMPCRMMTDPAQCGDQARHFTPVCQSTPGPQVENCKVLSLALPCLFRSPRNASRVRPRVRLLTAVASQIGSLRAISNVRRMQLPQMRFLSASSQGLIDVASYFSQQTLHSQSPLWERKWVRGGAIYVGGAWGSRLRS